MEIWKDIKSFNGLYQISNLGNVKSLNYNKTKKERLLKQGVTKCGYNTICLFKNKNKYSRTIHQLVAESFLNHVPCGHKLVINHIDFNKKNNNVLNLEIITARENCNLKHKKSSSKNTGVSWHKRDKVWSSSIYINGKLKHLGNFKNEDCASYAYKNAFIKHSNAKEKSEEYLNESQEKIKQ